MDITFNDVLAWLGDNAEPLSAVAAVLAIIAFAARALYALWNTTKGLPVSTRIRRMAFWPAVGAFAGVALYAAYFFVERAARESGSIVDRDLADIRADIDAERFHRALKGANRLKAQKNAQFQDSTRKILLLRCEIYVHLKDGKSAELDCLEVKRMAIPRGAEVDDETGDDQVRSSANLWLGEAWLLLDKPIEALAVFDSLVAQDESNARALTGRCAAVLEMRSFSSAANDCTEAIKIDPSNERARALRCAAIVESQFDHSAPQPVAISAEVADDCVRAAESKKVWGRSKAQVLMNACYARIEGKASTRDDSARKYCELAEKEGKNDAKMTPRLLARLHAMQCYSRRLDGNVAEALQSCRSAVALDTDNYFAQKELCVTNINVWEYKAAEVACNTAIRKSPLFPEAHNNLCVALFWQGEANLASADAACKQATSLRNDYALALKNRCRVQYWQKQYKEAADSCTAALAARLEPPAKAEALTYLCRSKRELGIAFPGECKLATSGDAGVRQPFALSSLCLAESKAGGDSALAEQRCQAAVSRFRECRKYQPLVAYDRRMSECPSGMWLDRMTVEVLLTHARLLAARGAAAEARANLAEARTIDPSNKDAEAIDLGLQSTTPTN